jgi:HD-GYP domain-containing protein (c-di-GMP phosphodiesterase class II)
MDDPNLADVAMKIGVYNYIIKPFEQTGVLISVRNALHRRQLEIDNRAYRESLQKQVAERTAALQDSMEKLGKALEGSIQAIARTVETRDPYTAGHQQRVADIASAMAVEMGLSDAFAYGIRMGGVIHDLGKISVPVAILSKPGRINNIEFDLIKTHPTVGFDILKTIEFPWPIAQMVLQHHERINGSGYPSGLAGEEVILEAKILGVADVVEAMASHRPYRPALGIDKALEEISKNRGELYDSDAVDICLKLFREKGFGLV